MVMGSVKVASSRQSESFFKEGRPAKRSRTEPTIVFWSSESLMPGARVMDLFSMPRLSAEGIPEWRIKLKA